MQRGDLIYNPSAGRFPSGILAERAANVLRDYGWEITLYQTENGGHVTSLARQAAEQGKDGLFVVGGDGSINLAVRGLLGSQTALGVLPGGTANVFAQELGLPGLTWTRLMALEESAHRLGRGSVREVDLGVAAGRPFLCWSGIGLDAFVIHRIEPRQRWEKHFAIAAYAASSVWQAQFWRGINLKACADGKVVEGHYLVAVMSNISLYAGGLARLSPDALLDDGVVDLWLLQGDTLGDVIQQAWDLIAGRHLESQSVQRVPFKHLLLESDRPLYVQVDAEPIEYDKYTIEVSVLPKALRVLVPEKPPRRLFVDETGRDLDFRRY
jgi:YegS/Rv2252/BmrU family lipid kinase